MSRPEVALVWAQARDGVIGRDGELPWHLPEDQQHFRQLTDGGCVVMGRGTWESLPERYRPLPGRRNVVLTHQPAYQAPGAQVRGDLAEVVEELAEQEAGVLWVIGGGQVYQGAMALADRLVVTEIDLEVDVETGTDVVRAPAVDPRWQRVSCDPEQGWHTSSTGLRYRICDYRLAEPPDRAAIDEPADEPADRPDAP